jgi:hypothetical protein
MHAIAFTTLFVADAVLLRFWDVGTHEKYILATLAYTAMIGAIVSARKEGGAL